MLAGGDVAGCGGGGGGVGGVHLHITPQGRHRYTLTKYKDILLSSSQKYLMGDASLLFNSDVVIHNKMHGINKIRRTLKANVNARVFPASPEFNRNFHHEDNVS